MILLLLLAHSVLELATAVNHCPSKPDSLPELINLVLPDNGCVKDENVTDCDVVLKMAPNVENDSFIDFYLEGNLKGWVAVGFSNDKQMVLTDVVGCKQDKDGSLGVINAWNPNVKPKHNVIDPSQDYMCNYSVKYEDSRIKCSFSRYSGIINDGYDYNLNGSYYIILGHSDNQNSLTEALAYHTVLPKIFEAKFNVYDFNPNNSNSTVELPAWNINLKKAHGIVMLIAWSVLASTGVFISSWMRPALVKGRWFQLHRGLMITSVPAVLIGLVCIFVSNKDYGVIIGFDCTLQTAHFVLGVTATVLMLINPILALVRCKPDSSNRWIFNMIHGPVGGLAVILGHFAIGTGLEYYQTGCNQCSTKEALIFFIYLLWQLGFVTLFQIILNVVFSIVAVKSHGKERYLLAPSFIKPCLKMPTSPPDDNEYTPINNRRQDNFDPSLPSKDYVLRAALFGIYTIVNCIVVLLLIGLIATTPPWACEA